MCGWGVCVRVCNWAVRGDRALLGGPLGNVHYGAEACRGPAAGNMLGGTAATGEAAAWQTQGGTVGLCVCVLPPPITNEVVRRRVETTPSVARVPTAGLAVCTCLSAFAGGPSETYAPYYRSPPRTPYSPLRA